MNKDAKILASGNPLDLIDLLFCPGGDAERAERRRIMCARDTALFRATGDRSDAVRAIYWIVVDEVQAWITSPASMDQLGAVARLATRLFQAAMERERLEVLDG